MAEQIQSGESWTAIREKINEGMRDTATIQRGAARTRLAFVHTADHQALPFTTLMPLGQETQQIAIQRAMMTEMGQFISQHGPVDGIFVFGDILDKATCTASRATLYNSVDWTVLGYPEMDRTYAAGDPPPMSYEVYLEDLRLRTGISRERFYGLYGNHDPNNSGKAGTKAANSWDEVSKWIGVPAYAQVFGEVGWLMLSDQGAGGTGGQIDIDTTEWADRKIKGTPGVTIWHLCTHHPMAGKGPTDNRTWLPTPGNPASIGQALTANQAAGIDQIVIGGYPSAHPDALIVYRDFVSTNTPGTQLVAGVDFTWIEPESESDDPDIPGNGTHEDNDNVYNRIILLQPLPTGTVIAGYTFIGSASLDADSTKRIRALFTNNPGKIRFHHYGHTGVINAAGTATHRPTIYDEELGAWLMCHNMSLPTRAQSGINTTTRPLIYSLMTVDVDVEAETTTFRCRRWNSTASQWLATTHPAIAATCDAELVIPRILDLGTPIHDRNASRDRPIDAPIPGKLVARRDIWEGQTWNGTAWVPDTSGLPERMLVTQETIVSDGARTNLEAGMEFGHAIKVPRGAGITVGDNLLPWQGDAPHVLAVQEGWRSLTASDSAPYWQNFLRFLSQDQTWRETFAADWRGFWGRYLGERIELGETSEGDVVLICRADRSKNGLPGESHFRQRIIGRRANSLTSTDDGMLVADVHLTTGSDGNSRAEIWDITPLWPRRHEWIYCDVAGARWLAIRQVGSSTDNPVRNCVWYLQGGHRPLDEPEAFTVVAAGSISNVTLAQAHSGNVNVNAALNNQRFVTHGNLVGTVSQSGGVPTGAVIETGGSGNHRYTRFADGTQICWGTVPVTPVANTPTSSAVTFAAAFVSVGALRYPAILVSVPGSQVEVSFANPTTTGFDAVVFRTNTTVTVVRYVAFGRWF